MKKLLASALLLAVHAFLPGSAFAVDCPANPPSLVSPVAGQVPFGNVTFIWNAVTFATEYELWVSVDGDPFSSKGTTAGTSRSVAIGAGRSIEWKVGAKKTSCTTMLSAAQAFTTSCPDDPTDLRDPDPGQTFAEGDEILFRWTAVAGAASYDVEVTPDFGETWTVLAENIETLSYTDEVPVGDWGWTVRANFDSCDPLYSAPSHFLVTTCSGEAPELTDPDNGEQGVDNPVEFRWREVDGASNYRLFVSIDDGPVSLLATTTNARHTATLAGTSVDWTVQAVFDACTPEMSTGRSFTLSQTSCPSSPGKPSLSSPAANATNLSSPVTFKWNSVSKATGYRVFAVFGSGEAVLLGSTTTTTLIADVPAGSGVWFVQTLFGDGCPTTLSERRAFTVTSGAQCGSAAPLPSYPPNGATNVSSPVEFRWSGVPDAIGYQLFAAAGNDELALYGTTEATSLVRLVPDGTVRWQVAAKFAACPETRSAVNSFVAGSTSDCPGGTIALLSPADGADVSSPAHLSWTALAGAEAYRVWVSIDGGAPLAILRTTATAADIQLPAGDIRWYVEALRTGCPSVVSGEGRFDVLRGANCDGNSAPVLQSPVGTEENPVELESSPATLVWSAAPGAIAYRVWLGEDDEPFADVALTKLTTAVVELEEGDYRWYVEALFEGCPSEESAVAFFEIEENGRCAGAPPSTILPAANSTVSSPVTFVWSEVDDAEKYRVFASRNGGDAILLGTTSETELERTLPPGEYDWAVEAVLEECPSVLSARSHFRIQESGNCNVEAATLVSPPDGAEGVGPEVQFVWNAVSGAIKYVLFLEIDEGAESAVATTEKTSVTRIVPPGKVEWWIVAIFPDCAPRKSPDFEFRVNRSQECRNAKPILLSPDEKPISSPVHFTWTAVPGSTGYRVWAWQGDDDPSIVAATLQPQAIVELAQGSYHWFVEALFEACPPTRSARAELFVAAPEPCGTPRKPLAKVVGRASSGNAYTLHWTALANVGLYEVQESASLDFATAPTLTTESVSMAFSHEATNSPVQYLYRVRGVSDCNDARGPYSQVVGLFVFPQTAPNSSAEAGRGEPVVQKVYLPGSIVPLQFVATSDKPWITIEPSQGTLPVEGITLAVTADPDMLALGTNSASISIAYSGGSKGLDAHDGTVSTVPFSVSLVTPVEPGGKGTPPPDALIFPAVAHAAGVNGSMFESDIRLTNLTAEIMKYDVTFTPSGLDGTLNGSSSTLEVVPGATIAVDDIISSFFGEGTGGASFGTLELRPVTTSAASAGGFFSTVTASAIRQLNAAASSRTYNFTPNGTYGQYIPAIPFSDFVGGITDAGPATILSLQQVAQSADYRANFGFVEGSGNPVDLQVRVYDTASTLLGTIPVSLQASEHRQIDQMLAANGITNLADGRVEVEVVGGTGKVTAYVSAIDNRTNDPLMVSAQPKGAITANRYVVPGAGFVNNGFAFWVTDLRIFNAGAATPATLTFYPMGNPGAPVSREITLDAGEIEVIDNILGDLFTQQNGAAGSIVITTPGLTQLTPTARTYNQTSNGTYGQYIPGVTAAQSVGLADRALQVLQLEQSSRFRTNIGVAETSGAPATVEVTAWLPDSIATPVVSINLAAHEFYQFPLASFGLGDGIYNARVSVKVIAGDGRVTAYGSAIDAITQDPTYVPAQ